MSLLLDHFFIVTSPGAPEAERLAELGLVEGSPNEHAGQGTANRRFFFHNAMLELGYVRDADEARNGKARGLRIVERAGDAGASPFGVILRGSGESAEAPFPGWRYSPDYFASDMFFHIGENSDLLEEPLCVVMPANPPVPSSQPLSPEPFRIVTALRIGVTVSRPSDVLSAVEEVEGITIECGVPHRMEIVFGDGRGKSSRDFRPALPLIVHW